MRTFWAVVGIVVLIFFVLLIGRLVLDWVRVFARDWRPQGPMLVIAEAIYSATDPPLKAIRRIIPPLRLGQVSIDLAFMVLFIVTLLLLQLIP